MMPINDLDRTDNQLEPRDSLKAPMVMAQAVTASRNDRSPEISASDEVLTAKRRNWSEVSGDRIETLNLGPVDRASILEHLLSNVRLEMSERYSSVLEEYDIARILEDSLSPAVKKICEQGKFDLIRHLLINPSSLLEIGQDPETKEEAGVYLHILWREDEITKRFWLYVGQACVLCLRIQKHKDPKHRWKNMGLHYAVWASAVDIKSAFVTLATLDAPSSTQTQLVLNLAEMWILLVAEKYNPVWSGNHLNVALPLWQGFTDTQENKAIADAIGGRSTFQQYLASEDSVIRAWAEQTRDAFNDIRNSPDPGIRSYWWNLHKERILTAQDTWGKKKASMAKQHLGGAKALVTLHSGNHGDHQTEVRAGSFRFTVSKAFGLDHHDGDEVILQYHLTPTPHPHAYALSALKTDPATRLGVSIRGQDSHGGFHCWLKATGECNLRKMNSLVDILEGYSAEESRGFKRRWFVTKSLKRLRSEPSGRNMYT
ncbi:hypothetical protein N7447_000191 [Penicillium robsamsonii]|uniref:uncharacterized protein n=1 Tax=Penicillium robsamsonii TaxID=1792511 RepID=UPI002546B764|nr:uncharacterized protein N7447_000191 [Penicillium robsamsonii]KAJ5834165.1 hypothetical protein N7447_000191 [Penicillium robsamsonii]